VTASALLPEGLALVALLAISLSGCVAIFAAARRGRSQRTSCYLLCAGAVLFLSGTILREVHGALVGRPSPFPSPADALYYAGYIALILALALLVRARRARREPANLVDALIVSAGLGMLIWAFVMTAYSSQEDLPVHVRLMAASYSVLDLILLGVLSRLAVGPGERNRSYYLLLLTITLIVVADVLTTMATRVPSLQAAAAVCSTLCFVTGGAAALHPGIETLTRRGRPSLPTLTAGRLCAIFSALALGPLALLVASASGRPVSTPTVVTGAALLSALVVARMAVQVRTNETRTARDTALRRASEQLIAATTREEMLGVAQAAVDDLGRGSSQLRSHIVQFGKGPIDGGPQVDQLSDAGMAALASRSPTVVAQNPLLQSEAFARNWVVCPLVTQDVVRGALVVSAASIVSPELVEGLAGLTAEVALALETAALMEDLHRQRSERRFQALIENSTDILLILNSERGIIYASPGASRVLGHSSAAMVGSSFDTFLPPDERPAVASALSHPQLAGAGHVQLELRLVDAAGAWHTLEATASDLRSDPDVGGIVLNARDATERKRLENELRHQALHDTLTGLPNRGLFTDRVRHALSRRSDEVGTVAVLFIDLDDFKIVNDTRGHAAGDQLLVAVAKRLRASLRGSDTPARFGGDEFAVLLDNTEVVTDVAEVVQRILHALHEPFEIDARELCITVSMGMALDAARSTSAQTLLRNADAAMYLAKQGGKGRWETYHDATDALAIERLELKSELATVLEDDGLVLHFHPIVDLETGRTISLEALVRWDHPRRGLIAPLQLIPLVEEAALIVPMSAWVLESACRQVSSLQGRQWGDVSVTVNVSVRHLRSDRFLDDVVGALQLANLDPSRLVLEVAESFLAADTQRVRRTLDALRSYGVKVAIDNFGSGYSSLGHLLSFPVDILKLDRALVVNMTTKSARRGIVRALVELADSMDVRLEAGGIETVEQRDALRAHGCKYGQGFLWSRPVPLGALVGAGPVLVTATEAQSERLVG